MYQNKIIEQGKNYRRPISELVRIVRDAGFACVLGLSAASCSIAPSLQPVATLPPKYAEPVVELLEVISEMSTEELMEKGMASFQNQDYNSSADFFSRAKDTGNLNDAGRALAYWHLGVVYSIIGDDRSDDAFDSFITVAGDIIDVRSSTKFAVNDDGEDFVERFDLQKRIMRAWTSLNSTWAKRAPYFGRSLENPVPVQSMDELEFFLELTDNCPQISERPREELPCNSSVEEEMPCSLYHVILKCDSEESSDEFYFQLNPEK